ncbi:hypothetical protein [Polaromonas sp.]|uniref:hypothetical protein n=1 Tax=Polaromonas sp. TaxID=1869339 RepID=UPI001802F8EC|nr:hypothetical protein [Polaromonas sp.]NML85804.1 hypothetical protein [Polaromonas sp.]
MIRFTPDTLSDALLRPVAMAAPNGWVYIEIMAPDFRFMFILALLLVWLYLGMRKKWQFSPVWVLLAFASVSFVPWMYTTGNGRYFIPVLLAAGPLCVALIHDLPFTKNFRVLMVLCVVAVQGFAVFQNSPWKPWNSWGFASWTEAPFFQVDLDAEASSRASSYVTISVISYSLIAPQFPASSRWINLSSQTGSDTQTSPDALRIQAFLKSSTSLKLMVPSLPDQMTAQGQPNEIAIRAMNVILSPHRISLREPTDCRLQRSQGLAKVVLGALENVEPERKNKIGFWLCSLSYPTRVSGMPTETLESRFESVFKKLEATCPRFFNPGQHGALPVPHGQMRHYQGADMKAYVFEDGTVYYKYHRALNPVLIGGIDDVLSGRIKVDCTSIRGRSGLPWEREI